MVRDVAEGNQSTVSMDKEVGGTHGSPLHNTTSEGGYNWKSKRGKYVKKTKSQTKKPRGVGKDTSDIPEQVQPLVQGSPEHRGCGTSAFEGGEDHNVMAFGGGSRTPLVALAPGSEQTESVEGDSHVSGELEKELHIVTQPLNQQPISVLSEATLDRTPSEVPSMERDNVGGRVDIMAPTGGNEGGSVSDVCEAGSKKPEEKEEPCPHEGGIPHLTETIHQAEVKTSADGAHLCDSMEGVRGDLGQPEVSITSTTASLEAQPSKHEGDVSSTIEPTQQLIITSPAGTLDIREATPIAPPSDKHEHQTEEMDTSSNKELYDWRRKRGKYVKKSHSRKAKGEEPTEKHPSPPPDITPSSMPSQQDALIGDKAEIIHVSYTEATPTAPDVVEATAPTEATITLPPSTHPILVLDTSSEQMRPLEGTNTHTSVYGELGYTVTQPLNQQPISVLSEATLDRTPSEVPSVERDNVGGRVDIMAPTGGNEGGSVSDACEAGSKKPEEKEEPCPHEGGIPHLTETIHQTEVKTSVDGAHLCDSMEGVRGDLGQPEVSIISADETQSSIVHTEAKPVQATPLSPPTRELHNICTQSEPVGQLEGSTSVASSEDIPSAGGESLEPGFSKTGEQGFQWKRKSRIRVKKGRRNGDTAKGTPSPEHHLVDVGVPSSLQGLSPEHVITVTTPITSVVNAPPSEQTGPVEGCVETEPLNQQPISVLSEATLDRTPSEVPSVERDNVGGPTEASEYSGDMKGEVKEIHVRKGVAENETTLKDQVEAIGTRVCEAGEQLADTGNLNKDGNVPLVTVEIATHENVTNLFDSVEGVRGDLGQPEVSITSTTASLEVQPSKHEGDVSSTIEPTQQGTLNIREATPIAPPSDIHEHQPEEMDTSSSKELYDWRRKRGKYVKKSHSRKAKGEEPTEKHPSPPPDITPSSMPSQQDALIGDKAEIIHVSYTEATPSVPYVVEATAPTEATITLPPSTHPILVLDTSSEQMRPLEGTNTHTSVYGELGYTVTQPLNQQPISVLSEATLDRTPSEVPNVERDNVGGRVDIMAPTGGNEGGSVSDVIEAGSKKPEEKEEPCPHEGGIPHLTETIHQAEVKTSVDGAHLCDSMEGVRGDLGQPEVSIISADETQPSTVHSEAKPVPVVEARATTPPTRELHNICTQSEPIGQLEGNTSVASSEDIPSAGGESLGPGFSRTGEQGFQWKRKSTIRVKKGRRNGDTAEGTPSPEHHLVDVGVPSSLQGLSPEHVITVTTPITSVVDAPPSEQTGPVEGCVETEPLNQQPISVLSEATLDRTPSEVPSVERDNVGGRVDIMAPTYGDGTIADITLLNDAMEKMRCGQVQTEAPTTSSYDVVFVMESNLSPTHEDPDCRSVDHMAVAGVSKQTEINNCPSPTEVFQMTHTTVDEVDPVTRALDFVTVEEKGKWTETSEYSGDMKEEVKEIHVTKDVAENETTLKDQVEAIGTKVCEAGEQLADTGNLNKDGNVPLVTVEIATHENVTNLFDSMEGVRGDLGQPEVSTTASLEAQPSKREGDVSSTIEPTQQGTLNIREATPIAPPSHIHEHQPEEMDTSSSKELYDWRRKRGKYVKKSHSRKAKGEEPTEKHPSPPPDITPSSMPSQQDALIGDKAEIVHVSYREATPTAPDVVEATAPTEATITLPPSTHPILVLDTSSEQMRPLEGTNMHTSVYGELGYTVTQPLNQQPISVLSEATLDRTPSEVPSVEKDNVGGRVDIMAPTGGNEGGSVSDVCEAGSKIPEEKEEICPHEGGTPHLTETIHQAEVKTSVDGAHLCDSMEGVRGDLGQPEVSIISADETQSSIVHTEAKPVQATPLSPPTRELHNICTQSEPIGQLEGNTSVASSEDIPSAGGESLGPGFSRNGEQGFQWNRKSTIRVKKGRGNGDTAEGTPSPEHHLVGVGVPSSLQGLSPEHVITVTTPITSVVDAPSSEQTGPVEGCVETEPLNQQPISVLSEPTLDRTPSEVLSVERDNVGGRVDIMAPTYGDGTIADITLLNDAMGCGQEQTEAPTTSSYDVVFAMESNLSPTHEDPHCRSVDHMPVAGVSKQTEITNCPSPTEVFQMMHTTVDEVDPVTRALDFVTVEEKEKWTETSEYSGDMKEEVKEIHVTKDVAENETTPKDQVEAIGTRVCEAGEQLADTGNLNKDGNVPLVTVEIATHENVTNLFDSVEGVRGDLGQPEVSIISTIASLEAQPSKHEGDASSTIEPTQQLIITSPAGTLDIREATPIAPPSDIHEHQTEEMDTSSSKELYDWRRKRGKYVKKSHSRKAKGEEPTEKHPSPPPDITPSSMPSQQDALIGDKAEIIHVSYTEATPSVPYVVEATAPTEATITLPPSTHPILVLDTSSEQMQPLEGTNTHTSVYGELVYTVTQPLNQQPVSELSEATLDRTPSEVPSVERDNVGGRVDIMTPTGGNEGGSVSDVCETGSKKPEEKEEPCPHEGGIPHLTETIHQAEVKTSVDGAHLCDSMEGVRGDLGQPEVSITSADEVQSSILHSEAIPVPVVEATPTTPPSRELHNICTQSEPIGQLEGSTSVASSEDIPSAGGESLGPGFSRTGEQGFQWKRKSTIRVKKGRRNGDTAKGTPSPEHHLVDVGVPSSLQGLSPEHVITVTTPITSVGDAPPSEQTGPVEGCVETEPLNQQPISVLSEATLDRTPSEVPSVERDNVGGRVDIMAPTYGDGTIADITLLNDAMEKMRCGQVQTEAPTTSSYDVVFAMESNLSPTHEDPDCRSVDHMPVAGVSKQTEINTSYFNVCMLPAEIFQMTHTTVDEVDPVTRALDFVTVEEKGKWTETSEYSGDMKEEVKEIHVRKDVVQTETTPISQYETTPKSIPIYSSTRTLFSLAMTDSVKKEEPCPHEGGTPHLTETIHQTEVKTSVDGAHLCNSMEGVRGDLGQPEVSIISADETQSSILHSEAIPVPVVEATPTTPPSRELHNICTQSEPIGQLEGSTSVARGEDLKSATPDRTPSEVPSVERDNVGGSGIVSAPTGRNGNHAIDDMVMPEVLQGHKLVHLTYARPKRSARAPSKERGALQVSGAHSIVPVTAGDGELKGPHPGEPSQLGSHPPSVSEVVHRSEAAPKATPTIPTFSLASELHYMFTLPKWRNVICPLDPDDTNTPLETCKEALATDVNNPYVVLTTTQTTAPLYEAIPTASTMAFPKTTLVSSSEGNISPLSSLVQDVVQTETTPTASAEVNTTDSSVSLTTALHHAFKLPKWRKTIGISAIEQAGVCEEDISDDIGSNGGLGKGRYIDTHPLNQQPISVLSEATLDRTPSGVPSVERDNVGGPTETGEYSGDMKEEVKEIHVMKGVAENETTPKDQVEAIGTRVCEAGEQLAHTGNLNKDGNVPLVTVEITTHENVTNLFDSMEGVRGDLGQPEVSIISADETQPSIVHTEAKPVQATPSSPPTRELHNICTQSEPIGQLEGSTSVASSEDIPSATLDRTLSEVPSVERDNVGGSGIVSAPTGRNGDHAVDDMVMPEVPRGHKLVHLTYARPKRSARAPSRERGALQVSGAHSIVPVTAGDGELKGPHPGEPSQLGSHPPSVGEVVHRSEAASKATPTIPTFSLASELHYMFTLPKWRNVICPLDPDDTNTPLETCKEALATDVNNPYVALTTTQTTAPLYEAIPTASTMAFPKTTLVSSSEGNISPLSSLVQDVVQTETTPTATAEVNTTNSSVSLTTALHHAFKLPKWRKTIGISAIEQAGVCEEDISDDIGSNGGLGKGQYIDTHPLNQQPISVLSEATLDRTPSGVPSVERDNVGGPTETSEYSGDLKEEVKEIHVTKDVAENETTPKDQVEAIGTRVCEAGEQLAHTGNLNKDGNVPLVTVEIATHENVTNLFDSVEGVRGDLGQPEVSITSTIASLEAQPSKHEGDVSSTIEPTQQLIITSPAGTLDIREATPIAPPSDIHEHQTEETDTSSSKELYDWRQKRVKYVKKDHRRKTNIGDSSSLQFLGQHNSLPLSSGTSSVPLVLSTDSSGPHTEETQAAVCQTEGSNDGAVIMAATGGSVAEAGGDGTGKLGSDLTQLTAALEDVCWSSEVNLIVTSSSGDPHPDATPTADLVSSNTATPTIATPTPLVELLTVEPSDELGGQGDVITICWGKPIEKAEESLEVAHVSGVVQLTETTLGAQAETFADITLLNDAMGCGQEQTEAPTTSSYDVVFAMESNLSPTHEDPDCRSVDHMPVAGVSKQTEITNCPSPTEVFQMTHTTVDEVDPVTRALDFVTVEEKGKWTETNEYSGDMKEEVKEIHVTKDVVQNETTPISQTTPINLVEAVTESVEEETNYHTSKPLNQPISVLSEATLDRTPSEVPSVERDNAGGRVDIMVPTGGNEGGSVSDVCEAGSKKPEEKEEPCPHEGGIPHLTETIHQAEVKTSVDGAHLCDSMEGVRGDLGQPEVSITSTIASLEAQPSKHEGDVSSTIELTQQLIITSPADLHETTPIVHTEAIPVPVIEATATTPPSRELHNICTQSEPIGQLEGSTSVASSEDIPSAGGESLESALSRTGEQGFQWNRKSRIRVKKGRRNGDTAEGTPSPEHHLVGVGVPSSLQGLSPEHVITVTTPITSVVDAPPSEQTGPVEGCVETEPLNQQPISVLSEATLDSTPSEVPSVERDNVGVRVDIMAPTSGNEGGSVSDVCEAGSKKPEEKEEPCPHEGGTPHLTETIHQTEAETSVQPMKTNMDAGITHQGSSVVEVPLHAEGSHAGHDNAASTWQIYLHAHVVVPSADIEPSEDASKELPVLPPQQRGAGLGSDATREYPIAVETHTAVVTKGEGGLGQVTQSAQRSSDEQTGDLARTTVALPSNESAGVDASLQPVGLPGGAVRDGGGAVPADPDVQHGEEFTWRRGKVMRKKKATAKEPHDNMGEEEGEELPPQPRPRSMAVEKTVSPVHKPTAQLRPRSGALEKGISPPGKASPHPQRHSVGLEQVGPLNEDAPGVPGPHSSRTAEGVRNAQTLPSKTAAAAEEEEKTESVFLRRKGAVRNASQRIKDHK